MKLGRMRMLPGEIAEEDTFARSRREARSDRLRRRGRFDSRKRLWRCPPRERRRGDDDFGQRTRHGRGRDDRAMRDTHEQIIVDRVHDR